MNRSIFVILLLERAHSADSDVLCLVGIEDGQFGIEGIEVQPGHFLVEHLGQLVDPGGEGLLGSVLPELELGEGLVAERGRHDEGGVAGGAAQVEEAA